ncbi:hypothetical protein K4F52_005912 [Lecanicillium sp. MT-2017a]|nr:hypothetical protein K4F52_005912 [Lecanicillium sp. MT-2017a]
MDDPDGMDIVPVLSAANPEDEAESYRTVAETDRAPTSETLPSFMLSSEEQLAKGHCIADGDQEDRESYLTATQFKARMTDLEQGMISRMDNLEEALSRRIQDWKAARDSGEVMRQIQPMFERLDNSMSDRFHELVRHWRHEENELQSSKKTVDNEIQTLWTSLDYNIRCTAYAVVGHRLKRHDNLNTGLKGALAALGNESAHLYNNDNTQHLVIQAYIWRRLCENVIAEDNGLWKPKQGPSKRSVGSCFTFRKHMN